MLYRWTDAAGVPQVPQTPPPDGHDYEKVDVQPREWIEIDGSRQ